MKNLSNHVIIFFCLTKIREKILLIIKDFQMAHLDAAKDFLNFK